MSIIFVFINFSLSELLFFYTCNMPEMVLSPNFLHFQKINFLVGLIFYVSKHALSLHFFLKCFQYFQIFYSSFVFITLYFLFFYL